MTLSQDLARVVATATLGFDGNEDKRDARRHQRGRRCQQHIVVNLLGVAFDWPMAASIGVVTIILGMLLISIAQYFEHRGAVRL